MSSGKDEPDEVRRRIIIIIIMDSLSDTDTDTNTTDTDTGKSAVRWPRRWAKKKKDCPTGALTA